MAKKESKPFVDEEQLERAVDREKRFLEHVRRAIAEEVVIAVKPALDSARRAERLVTDLVRRVDNMGVILQTTANGVENINSVLTARLLVADGQDQRIERLLDLVQGVVDPPKPTPPETPADVAKRGP